MSAKITSPDQLRALRDKTRGAVDLRGGEKDLRITVHMGTCGIAAGARDILSAVLEALDKAGVENVSLRQSGCIGLCDKEPMLTIADKAGTEHLYVGLTKAKAAEIVKSHVVGGTPVEGYIMKGATT